MTVDISKAADPLGAVGQYRMSDSLLLPHDHGVSDRNVGHRLKTDFQVWCPTAPQKPCASWPVLRCVHFGLCMRIDNCSTIVWAWYNSISNDCCALDRSAILEDGQGRGCAMWYEISLAVGCLCWIWNSACWIPSRHQCLIVTSNSSHSRSNSSNCCMAVPDRRSPLP